MTYAPVDIQELTGYLRQNLHRFKNTKMAIWIETAESNWFFVNAVIRYKNTLILDAEGNINDPLTIEDLLKILLTHPTAKHLRSHPDKKIYELEVKSGILYFLQQ